LSANRLSPLPVGFVVLLAFLVSLSPPATVYGQAAPAPDVNTTVPADMADSAEQTVDDGANDVTAPPAQEPVSGTLDELQVKIDEAFGTVNKKIDPVLSFDISFGAFQIEQTDQDGAVVIGEDGRPVTDVVVVPLIIVLLLAGGIFFSFRFGFINFRLFFHSIAVIRGKYDDPDDHGEITHFQALTSALSATVGLGNIAGVAIAISQGGAGAVFWMWVVAIFGMCSKFSSCSLAQMYRRIEPEGKKQEHILGGPMLYLEKGMPDMLGKVIGWPLGKVLAISFAFFAIMGALGGGNMFQANQTAEIVSWVMLDGDKSYAWLVGLTMAFLVGLVIVGGIKRIGEVTCRIVPAMCVFYCVVCVLILATNFREVPGLFRSIFQEAFTLKAAGWGGLMAIFVIGLKRGAFSNEAGLGSAAIAHSAAKTNEPIREGVVAMIGPFIDTIVVCTMTALTILITQGQFEESALGETAGWTRGAAMTAEAFGTLHGFMPILLCFAVFVFAYSTMISWSYYGERATEYLFGKAGIWPFRIVFLLFIVIGPMVSLSNVLEFTDLLILSMAYPNIIGMVILSPKVAKMTKDYVRRLKSGEMKPYAAKKEDVDGEPSI
jgi:alanine or glycine:cation symporter, AGCS family